MRMRANTHTHTHTQCTVLQHPPSRSGANTVSDGIDQLCVKAAKVISKTVEIDEDMVHLYLLCMMSYY